MVKSAEQIDQSEKKKIADYESSISGLAQEFAYGGEWMWAMARSIERGKPFFIYAYATRSGGKWTFEMHVENPGIERPTEPPCFGWKVPHIYVPVGEIFIATYNDCKKVLGLTSDEDA